MPRSVRKPPSCDDAVDACEVEVEDYGGAEVHPLVPTQFFQYAVSDSDEDPTDGEAWWTGVESLMQQDAAGERANDDATTPAASIAVRRRIRCKRPPKPNEDGGRRTKAKRPG